MTRVGMTKVLGLAAQSLLTTCLVACLPDSAVAQGSRRFDRELALEDSAATSANVSIGDVNGGATADVWVGRPEDAGAAHLVYGPISASLDLTSADLTLTGDGSSDLLGHDASTGDLDGDGYDDWVVAAPGGDGRVVVVHGGGL